MKFNLNINLSQNSKNKNFKKEKLQINPDKYWIFVLIFNGLIIISAFVFGYFMFNNLETKSIIEETALNKQGVNEKRLQEVLEFFDDRKEKSEKNRLDTLDKVDPSI